MALERNLVFLSHANPEDNEIVTWLGARLSAAGYTAWADLLNLRGSQNWPLDIETAIRQRASKVIIVLSRAALTKQGVRNEITIADGVARQLAPVPFIIPLRVDDFPLSNELPFQLVNIQAIDFRASWETGFHELLEVLNESDTPRNVKSISPTLEDWCNHRQRRSNALQPISEILDSNWLCISDLPEVLNFYQIDQPIQQGSSKDYLEKFNWPVETHLRYLVPFANLTELRSQLRQNTPVSLKYAVDLSTFLDRGEKNVSVDKQTARNLFATLVRQAWNKFASLKGLQSYNYSERTLGWWVPDGLIRRNQVAFDWPTAGKGRRQLVGRDNVRSVFWHFGVSVRMSLNPFAHVIMIPRVLFTRDGQNIQDTPARLHQLRRTVCRSWRNQKWRDLLHALLYWISDSGVGIRLQFSSRASAVVDVPFLEFESPISINDGKKQTAQDQLDDLEERLMAEDPTYDPGGSEDDEEIESNVFNI